MESRDRKSGPVARTPGVKVIVTERSHYEADRRYPAKKPEGDSEAVRIHKECEERWPKEGTVGSHDQTETAGGKNKHKKDL